MIELIEVPQWIFSMLMHDYLEGLSRKKGKQPSFQIQRVLNLKSNIMHLCVSKHFLEQVPVVQRSLWIFDKPPLLIRLKNLHISLIFHKAIERWDGEVYRRTFFSFYKWISAEYLILFIYLEYLQIILTLWIRNEIKRENDNFL